MHGLDNLNAYYDVSLKRARLDAIGRQERFSFSAQDVTDYAGLKALFARFRPDCVVHLAAQAACAIRLTNPRAYVSSNLDGFVAVLVACRAHPVRHLVYASSSSVYGANSKVPYHEDDPVVAPVSLYAATKRANELMAQTYAHLYAIPCSGVRFFTVYGPWGRPGHGLLYVHARPFWKGRPIDVFNHGRMQRDFTYIDDVVEALGSAGRCRHPPTKCATVNPTGGSAHHLQYRQSHADRTRALHRHTGSCVGPASAQALPADAAR